jgi:hypothetical protein
MAHLNKQERDALLDELKNKKFERCQRILVLKDPKVRMKFWRNSQEVGRWMTRYILPSYGTQVTLVEGLELTGDQRKFVLSEIIIEPTPDNNL